MKLSIRVDSARMERTLGALSRLAVRRVEDAVMDSTLAIQNAAKERCPVDTGRLRNSIGNAPDAEAGPNTIARVVGTNVEYAPFQEWGTRTMPAHSFLTPSFFEEVPRFEQRLARALVLAKADARKAGL